MKRYFATLFFLCGGIFMQGQVAQSPIPRNNPVEVQESQTVLTLLNSLETKEHAWAAYLAEKYRLVELIPQLKNLLRPVSSFAANYSTTESEQQYLNRIVLGALIQLDASLTSNELMAYYEEFPDEVIILMAKSPKEHENALLSMIREKMPEDRWLAACNLLAKAQAPGFAAQLLREIKIVVSVTVVDQQNYGPGVGVGWGVGSGGGDGGYSAPRGFPPWFQYGLTTYPLRGDVVVAPGPHTVYYRRHFGWSTYNTQNDRDQYRREYLALLVGQDLRLFNFDTRVYRTIQWTGADEFTRQVGNLGERERIIFRTLVNDLLQKGLLSEEEATALKPNISIVVQDMRKDKSISLPVLSF
jgi:hypothetical protein